MGRRNKAMKPIFAALCVLLLAACNAEERGHVVRLDKGGYKGAADAAVSEATLQSLRARIALQSEGPARVAINAGPAMLPQGESQPQGRLVGQKF